METLSNNLPSNESISDISENVTTGKSDESVILDKISVSRTFMYVFLYGRMIAMIKVIAPKTTTQTIKVTICVSLI